MRRTFSVLLFISASWPGAAQLVSVEEAVELALEKNFDVRVQRATAASAFNDNRFANGAFLPQLNASAAYLKSSNDSRAVTFANVETVRNGVRTTNINATGQLSWTLFDGTRMFATRQRIAQLAELGEVNVKNQMMNSVAAVITNYYNIVRQKQQLEAIHVLIKVNEERVKLAEKKLQVGTGGKPELLQAKVDFNANRILALQQETLIQQLKDQLNGLLGMGLPDVYEISDTIPINLTLTQEQITTEIESTNQALLAAKKNIDIANTSIWENRAARSPVVSLNAAYNYSKTQNALATSPFSLQFSRNKGYNYGLSVGLPILNGFNTSRLINQAKITLERQNLIYQQLKTLAIVGVRNAFTSYENAKKALIIEEENILLAKENVFIALESFKMGVATYIELRTAQQTLADTYSQLILARFNAKAAETELLRLKGDLLK
ncbi:MAG TPA: TolC family protein [Cyclobacteriaceae bacterium]|nr:TolC family protein [Cyclobacteriaceae bacterium]